MNAMSRIRIVVVVIEIFQPAHMIEISHIENIVPHDIEFEDRLTLAIGKPCAYSCIDEGISIGRCFGTIIQVSPALFGIPGQLDFHKGVDDMAVRSLKIIPQFRQPMHRRDERQVFGAVRTQLG